MIRRLTLLVATALVAAAPFAALSAPSAPAMQPSPAARTAPAAGAPGADANRATQAELESVKGIGPRLSGRILQARESGPFRNWADLIERVPGVGAGNAARYSQAGLTVAGAAFDPSALATPAKSASESRRERRSDGEVKPSRKPRERSEAAVRN